MTPFSLNYDSNQVNIPFGMLFNAPPKPTKITEITVDTDIKTISAIISESLIEIVKKSFETTSKSFEEKSAETLTELVEIL